MTLHQDAVTLQADLKGLQSVKEYYTTYFDQYTYTHVPLVSAANINTNTVFSFGIEKVKSCRVFACFVMEPALRSTSVRNWERVCRFWKYSTVGIVKDYIHIPTRREL